MLFPLRPLFVVALVVIGIVGVYSVYLATSGPGPATGDIPVGFTINGKSFVFTYIATTQPEREQGLMNRKITNTTTMLFAFPSPVSQPFWMYQTNTSLDIIWVNAEGFSGSVVYIADNTQPCPGPASSCPDYPANGSPPLANYVIEARAGFATANMISVGTPITFG